MPDRSQIPPQSWGFSGLRRLGRLATNSGLTCRNMNACLPLLLAVWHPFATFSGPFAAQPQTDMR